MTQHSPDDPVDAAMAEAWRTPEATSVLDALRALGYPVPDHWVARSGAADAEAEAGPTHKRYNRLAEIARGGMGVVIRGRDVDLGRDVAMKVLRPDKAQSPELLARFIEEAQVGGQLQHPGIVPVYDLGVQEGGQAYFTMKLIEGETLASLLAAAGCEQRTGRRFLRIYEQLCETIAYAHSRGVIHRDLKPQNVMVGAFGEVQVVDWGLAKVVTRTGSRRTARAAEDAGHVHTVRSDSQDAGSMVGAVVGTPAYMPREQALGDVEGIGTPADVFSLGAILCEILTGKPPYLPERGNLLVQAGKADLEEAHERLDACGAHPDLVRLCRRCLGREADARPPDASALAAAVSEHLTAREEHARRAQIAAAQAEVEVREERRRRRLTLALGAAVVLGVAITAGLWWSFEKQDLERVQDNTLAVRDAVADAMRLETQARAAAADALPLWEQANVASERAVEIAETVEVGLAVRTDARAAAERIAAGRAQAALERAQAARDADLRMRLEEIRSRSWDTREFAYLDEAYADTFEQYGIDLQAGDPAAASTAIRASTVGEDIVAALDVWAAAKRRQGSTQQEAAARLHALASATDSDPWSRKVRSAAQARDADALHALADEVEALSAHDALRIANGLAEAVNAREGAEFLARHQRAHSGDFWLNFQLGRWLADETLGEPDPVRALGYLRAAQALRPEDVETLRHLGMALAGVGREEEALALWREALDKHPRNFFLHIAILQLLRKRGELEDYAASLEQALASGQGTAEDYVRLASILANTPGRIRESNGLFQKAYDLDPTHDRALRGLGYCAMNLNQLTVARDHFRIYLERQPSDWRVWCWLTQVYRGRREWKEMFAAAQEAVRAGPDVPEANLQLAWAHLNLQQLDEAVAAYHRIGERYPDHPRLLRFGVRVAEQLQMKWRHAEARRLAEDLMPRLFKALPSSRNPRQIHDDLGILYVKCFWKVDEAIKHQMLAAQVSGADPGKLSHPDIGDLSRAHRMKGDHRGALPWLRRLVAEMPDHVQPMMAIGWRQRFAQSLLMCGELEEALGILQAIYDIKEDTPYRGFCVGHLGAGRLWTGKIEEGRRLLREISEVAEPEELEEYGAERYRSDADTMARLAPDARAILAGEKTLEDPHERRIFAHLCMYLHRFRDAARIYEAILAEHPQLAGELTGFDLGSTVRMDAAHCLMLAGRGQGEGGRPDADQCVRAAKLVLVEAAEKEAALARGDEGALARLQRFYVRYSEYRWHLESIPPAARSAWTETIEALDRLIEESRQSPPGDR